MCIEKLGKNYSIFLRRTCFGKEESFFLLLPMAFPATSAVFLGLLLTPSVGLAKGEISLISTGGGDQELSFSMFLKKRCNSSKTKHIIENITGFPIY